MNAGCKSLRTVLFLSLIASGEWKVGNLKRGLQDDDMDMNAARNDDIPVLPASIIRSA